MFLNKIFIFNLINWKISQLMIKANRYANRSQFASLVQAFVFLHTSLFINEFSVMKAFIGHM